MPSAVMWPSTWKKSAGDRRVAFQFQHRVGQIKDRILRVVPQDQSTVHAFQSPVIPEPFRQRAHQRLGAGNDKSGPVMSAGGGEKRDAQMCGFAIEGRVKCDCV